MYGKMNEDKVWENCFTPTPNGEDTPSTRRPQP
jgi:hypothetical protein